MLISDLNYMESVEVEVNGAGGVYFDNVFKKIVDIKKNVKYDINKTIVGVSYVLGNIGTAEAGADAHGPNSLTETEAFSQAVHGKGSQSFSQALASTNGYVKMD